MLRICVFGTGYVGLVSGACFAEMGHVVVCCDTDQEKINDLDAGKIPIYEIGLKEIVDNNVNKKKLSFTRVTNVDIKQFDLVVIAVGTPNDENGKTDMRYVNSVVDVIENNKHHSLTVMVKSTVPLGTCKNIYDRLNNENDSKIDVVSNPEFLREGSAVKDFLEPERVVLGFFCKNTKNKLNDLYKSLENKTTIIHTDCSTSELIKYASNGFLATKVAFINEMASICEKIGADIQTVSEGMGLDSRIGKKFLQPGPGFGGSCFPKDIRALETLTENLGSNNQIISSVEKSNNVWKEGIAAKIANYMKQKNLARVCFWGVTYKADTDDVRSSAAIDIIIYLLKKGINIQCHDPEGLPKLRKYIGEKVLYIDDMYNATQHSDLIIIATEWDIYKNVDFKKISKDVKAIFDLRNVISIRNNNGIEIIKLGKNSNCE